MSRYPPWIFFVFIALLALTVTSAPSFTKTATANNDKRMVAALSAITSPEGSGAGTEIALQDIFRMAEKPLNTGRTESNFAIIDVIHPITNVAVLITFGQMYQLINGERFESTATNQAGAEKNGAGSTTRTNNYGRYDDMTMRVIIGIIPGPEVPNRVILPMPEESIAYIVEFRSQEKNADNGGRSLFALNDTMQQTSDTD